jgi:signal transduction histidine kinase
VNSLRLLKVVLAVSITVFALAGAYVSFTVMKREQVLREISRYNMVWAVSQALPEYMRFENRVAAFGLGLADKEEVKLRLDILFNRLEIFQHGDVRAFTADQLEQASVVDELRNVLARADPMVDTIDRPGSVERILTALKPLEARLSRFAAAANQYGGDQVAADQQLLLKLHWTFSALTAGLFVCGLMLIGILYLQNRLLAKAHNGLMQLADELRIAKAAAETGSAAKSRFLATMSHELRTPLNAVIGFSEIISSQSFGPVGQPRYADYAGDVLKAGRHMLDVVNDVLTMAKLDADRYEPALEQIDVQSLTERTVAIFRGTEIGQRHEIAIVSEGDWPTIRADGQALRQMLLNLLSNAAKFSADGTPIEVSCRRSGDELRLAVSDCGIGMTPEQLAQVGQPFFQVDDHLARRHAGSGLGLSIVSGLLRCHGGRLEIDSTPGVGTRVDLVFPLPVAAARELAQVA